MTFFLSLKKTGHVNSYGVRACYDEGKRVGEALCFEWLRKGVDTRVIRIFNTYGPFMDPNDGRVVSNFICQALKNKDLTIYGDGQQTRSFQYVDDLVNAMVAFVRSTGFHGPLNVGNPNECTVLQLAELVLKKIPTSRSAIVRCEAAKDDPTRRCPNIGTCLLSI